MKQQSSAPVYEPSVEGGQVFTKVTTMGKFEQSGLDEVDPEKHSVSRGTRQQRNALVVVTESEQNAEAATCQYPGKKDQDRYTVQLSADPAVFPHYIGLFDGHGTSVFAADLCAAQMLQQVLGPSDDQEERQVCVPSDESIVRAYKALHETTCDMVKKHPRSGTTAVTV